MATPEPSNESPPGVGGGVIFISHSSRDRKIAQTICGALEHRGLRCWVSSRDIGPGENFQEAIVRAIRGSRVMVLVFTGHANNSNEIKKEMALASQHNLAVIPIRVEDVVPNDAFAYEFATRQWIDTFDNWENAIERLSLQLNTVLRGGSVAEAVEAGAAVPPAAAATKRTPGLVLAGLVLLAVAAAGAYFAFERAPSAPASRQAAAPQAAAPPAAAPPAAAPQAAAPPAAAPPAAAPQATASQATAPPAEAPPAAAAPGILAEANHAYRDKHFDEAFRLYQQAAAQGLPLGEFWLGLLYQRGLGTPSDYGAAMSWYRKAADQGSSNGVGGMGQLYQQGLGVPQDFAAAQRLFREAADKGAPIGFIGLGSLYQNGQGVPRDYAEAMRDYREAADHNGPNAGYFIGMMYEEGLGVPVNRREGRRWMRQAADAGSVEARDWIEAHPVARDQ